MKYPAECLRFFALLGHNDCRPPSLRWEANMLPLWDRGVQPGMEPKRITNTTRQLRNALERHAERVPMARS